VTAPEFISKWQKVDLTETVCAAYGWSPGLTNDELLAKLLAMNLERAAAEGESADTMPLELEVEEDE
jgi:hypothetical protein